MNDLDSYLNKIQSKESFFPIDSFPDKKEEKKKNILRTVYPESEANEDELDLYTEEINHN